MVCKSADDLNQSNTNHNKSTNRSMKNKNEYLIYQSSKKQTGMPAASLNCNDNKSDKGHLDELNESFDKLIVSNDHQHNNFTTNERSDITLSKKNTNSQIGTTAINVQQQQTIDQTLSNLNNLQQRKLNLSLSNKDPKNLLKNPVPRKILNTDVNDIVDISNQTKHQIDSKAGKNNVYKKLDHKINIQPDAHMFPSNGLNTEIKNDTNILTNSKKSDLQIEIGSNSRKLNSYKSLKNKTSLQCNANIFTTNHLNLKLALEVNPDKDPYHNFPDCDIFTRPTVRSRKKRTQSNKRLNTKERDHIKRSTTARRSNKRSNLHLESTTTQTIVSKTITTRTSIPDIKTGHRIDTAKNTVKSSIKGKKTIRKKYLLCESSNQGNEISSKNTASRIDTNKNFDNSFDIQRDYSLAKNNDNYKMPSIQTNAVLNNSFETNFTIKPLSPIENLFESPKQQKNQTIFKKSKNIKQTSNKNNVNMVLSTRSTRKSVNYNEGESKDDNESLNNELNDWNKDHAVENDHCKFKENTSVAMSPVTSNCNELNPRIDGSDENDEDREENIGIKTEEDNRKFYTPYKYSRIVRSRSCSSFSNCSDDQTNDINTDVIQKIPLRNPIKNTSIPIYRKRTMETQENITPCKRITTTTEESIALVKRSGTNLVVQEFSKEHFETTKYLLNDLRQLQIITNNVNNNIINIMHKYEDFMTSINAELQQNRLEILNCQKRASETQNRLDDVFPKTRG